ncbi:ABC transporter ATP-binding protein [Clostridium cellulovorans]|uniref:ABC transporter related n=1 Tax=Clostridium cellulovorans (strain ATCC 35296 / DSM 3052 / OCM 3 / 743B) TaxID=573061 RepID=D9ST11_CLOC7|nr:ATP-binding cassette domain-containing protein [Clostridium cellulovorans]ADL52673.1 ABC transporter related [Clostridium cellulovorans 743B]
MDDILFQANNLIYKENLVYDNLIVKKEKINFITGESGSGKSTFLKLLNNTISATAGVLLYKNKPIEQYDPIALRRDISLVSQDPFLFDMSIIDNFKTFYSLRDMTVPENDHVRFFADLCSVNVSLDQDAATLSGGERQRVYISLFLSLYPKVILLDEPTSALDEKNSKEIMKNITSFCKKENIDIVIVSHDKAIVEEFYENKIEIVKKVQ